MIDGPTLVGDALAAGVEAVDAFVVRGRAPEHLLVALEDAGVPCHEVTADTLRGATDPTTPQGIAVVARAGSLPALRWPVAEVAGGGPDAGAAGGPLLLLDAVGEPGNVGALIRSAEAAGAVGVVAGEGSADLLSPKVVRASAGSRFRVPVGGGDLLAILGGLPASVRRLAAVAGAGTAYDETDLTGPLAIVVGSEAHGVSPSLMAVVDAQVHVPTVGVESLNVAMAGTLLLFEAARQRRATVAASSPRTDLPR